MVCVAQGAASLWHRSLGRVCLSPRLHEVLPNFTDGSKAATNAKVHQVADETGELRMKRRTVSARRSGTVWNCTASLSDVRRDPADPELMGRSRARCGASSGRTVKQERRPRMLSSIDRHVEATKTRARTTSSIIAWRSSTEFFLSRKRSSCSGCPLRDDLPRHIH